MPLLNMGIFYDVSFSSCMVIRCVALLYCNKCISIYRIRRFIVISTPRPMLMPKDTLRYTKDDLTVVWKPNLCIHSTLCWKGLIGVFNPRARPWVNMEGADAEKIIQQVKKCPSGALSYEMNGQNTPSKTEVAAEGKMLSIEILKNGPILIKTECSIRHSDGSEEIKTGTTALCRCGASSTKPYCDGTHNNTGFQG